MGAGAKVNGMYSTPQRVRASVRSAVRFGEAFPLYAPEATAEGAEAEPAARPTHGRTNRIDLHGTMSHGTMSRLPGF